jgi:hypothetical protein
MGVGGATGSADVVFLVAEQTGCTWGRDSRAAAFDAGFFAVAILTVVAIRIARAELHAHIRVVIANVALPARREPYLAPAVNAGLFAIAESAVVALRLALDFTGATHLDTRDGDAGLVNQVEWERLIGD